MVTAIRKLSEVLEIKDFKESGISSGGLL